jgi:hypothetical protein
MEQLHQCCPSRTFLLANSRSSYQLTGFARSIFLALPNNWSLRCLAARHGGKERSEASVVLLLAMVARRGPVIINGDGIGPT